MGYHAFEECPAQIKETEGGVIYYEKWAIDYEDDIAAVVLRDGTVGIAAKAFRNCSSLTSITIPDSVIGIASDAFFGCNGLTSITIPDGVTSIGNYAFRNCSGLMSITIPDSVKSIGSGAFSGCSSLESITIPFVGGSEGKTSSSTYQYPFGYIFGTSSYTGGTAVRQYYYGSSTSSATSTNYYIPSSLRSVTVTGGNVLYGAFYNCSMLTSVTIGDGVTSIGSSAFYNCDNLKYNEYGNAYYLGNGTNPYLVLVDIIDVSITSFVIGEQTRFIYDSAFYGCGGLTSITIPDGVTSIGYMAFAGCTGLTSVTFNGTIDEWNAIGKSIFWYVSCPFSEVVCSDGTVNV